MLNELNWLNMLNELDQTNKLNEPNDLNELHKLIKVYGPISTLTFETWLHRVTYLIDLVIVRRVMFILMICITLFVTRNNICIGERKIYFIRSCKI